MTVNNYGIFQNPLQNPSNPNSFYMGNNPNGLTVPKAKPFSIQNKEYWDNIHTPCQNQIPIDQEGKIQYMDQDRFMKLPDGSVIDLKLHKLVKSGEQADNNIWGEGFKQQIKEECWDDNVNNVIDSGTGMTKKDYERQAFLDRKEKELKNNMSPLQKELLKELENGQIFPLSKLVECI